MPVAIDEWAYMGAPPDSYKVVPAYAWAFHEMFRHSDLYQLGGFTFAELARAGRVEECMRGGIARAIQSSGAARSEKWRRAAWGVSSSKRAVMSSCDA